MFDWKYIVVALINYSSRFIQCGPFEFQCIRLEMSIEFNMVRRTLELDQEIWQANKF